MYLLPPFPTPPNNSFNTQSNIQPSGSFNCQQPSSQKMILSHQQQQQQQDTYLPYPPPPTRSYQPITNNIHPPPPHSQPENSQPPFALAASPTTPQYDDCSDDPLLNPSRSQQQYQQQQQQQQQQFRYPDHIHHLQKPFSAAESVLRFLSTDTATKDDYLTDMADLEYRLSRKFAELGLERSTSSSPFQRQHQQHDPFDRHLVMPQQQQHSYMHEFDQGDRAFSLPSTYRSRHAYQLPQQGYSSMSRTGAYPSHSSPPPHHHNTHTPPPPNFSFPLSAQSQSQTPPQPYTCKLCLQTTHYLKNCPLYNHHRRNPAQQQHQKTTIPPDGYICRKCHVPGHWIQQCLGGRGVPDGYCCKICGIKGHWIHQCPQRVPRSYQ